MTCKRILAVAVVCAVALGSVGSTKAAILFQENWSGVISGPYPLVDGFSQRSANVSIGHYDTVTLPANWTAAGQVLGWTNSNTASDPVTGILLNEGVGAIGPGSITLNTLITGLIPNETYNLSFAYWGDNRPTDLPKGGQYEFDYTINGLTSSITDSWQTSQIGTFNVVNRVFTASGTTADLSFAAINISEASPIIGEMTVASVPEPATLIIWSLLGGLGVAVGLRRRRKAA